MGVGVQRHAVAALPLGKTPGFQCVLEARWSPGPDWNGAENLAPIGIRSPQLPAHSESLYRLNYPGPWRYIVQDDKC
jgi:hypothetical protein